MGTPTTDPAAAARQLAEAHRALRADPTVQFDLSAAPPPPQPPHWLVALEKFLDRLFAPLGRLLAWLFGRIPGGPIAQALLWTVLACLAAAIVGMVVVRLREGRWRLPRRRLASAEAAAPEEDWTPEAAPARALLAEADALAAQGRFAEAVHLLLRRSVEDIARRRPRLVRPALTSRDLSAAVDIPMAPRLLFAGIARQVERSLFGGRPLDQQDWTQARAAYADLALPRSWAHAA